VSRKKHRLSPLEEERLSIIHIILWPLIWAAGWIALMGKTYRGMRWKLLKWAKNW